MGRIGAGAADFGRRDRGRRRLNRRFSPGSVKHCLLLGLACSPRGARGVRTLPSAAVGRGKWAVTMRAFLRLLESEFLQARLSRGTTRSTHLSIPASRYNLPEMPLAPPIRRAARWRPAPTASPARPRPRPIRRSPARLRADRFVPGPALWLFFSSVNS